MNQVKNKRKPWHFFMLTFVYAWGLWLPSILSGLGLDIPFNATSYTAVVIPIGAFAPLLAAITLIYQKEKWTGVKAFLLKAIDFRTRAHYFILALLIPLIIHAIAHYLAPVIGLEVSNTLFPDGLEVLSILLAVPYFFIILIIGGGQEEFGWRGYAQEPLQERFGEIPTSLLIGVIWIFWHLPIWAMPVMAMPLIHLLHF